MADVECLECAFGTIVRLDGLGLDDNGGVGSS